MGYSGEMKAMVAQNPGVRSRFPTVIDFADYSTQELLEIAHGMMKKDNFNLSSEAEEVITNMFSKITAKGGKDNGNGREVRNILEAARRKQALRLLEIEGKKSAEQLSQIELEDLAQGQ